MAFDQDKAFIQEFFARAEDQRKENLMNELQQWQQQNHSSFDSVWKKLKKDILTKQEN